MNNAIVVVVVVVASIKKKKLQIGAANYSQNWLPNCWQKQTSYYYRFAAMGLFSVKLNKPIGASHGRHIAASRPFSPPPRRSQLFFFFWGWVLDCSWVDQCNAAFAISM
jgi:hypothetical protein